MEKQENNARARVYIVDWDIPTEKRRMFYYHLNKIKARREISGSMSSMSVMVVSDKDLALEVYGLASKYGRSSIYEGVLLEGFNHREPIEFKKKVRDQDL